MNVLEVGFFVAVAALAVLAAREYVPRDAVQAVAARVGGVAMRQRAPASAGTGSSRSRCRMGSRATTW